MSKKPEILVLEGPPFKTKVEIPMFPSRKYLKYGFYALYKEGKKKDALIHFIYSLISLGGYWIYFARKHHLLKARLLVNKGYQGVSAKDREILKYYNIKPFKKDNGYIGMSRTSSVDHMIGPTAKDFERKKFK